MLVNRRLQYAYVAARTSKASGILHSLDVPWLRFACSRHPANTPIQAKPTFKSCNFSGGCAWRGHAAQTPQCHGAWLASALTRHNAKHGVCVRRASAAKLGAQHGGHIVIDLVHPVLWVVHPPLNASSQTYPPKPMDFQATLLEMARQAAQSLSTATSRLLWSSPTLCSPATRTAPLMVPSLPPYASKPPVVLSRVSRSSRGPWG